MLPVDTPPDQGRRQFLAAGVLMEFNRLFETWLPPRSSFDDWFRAIRLDDARGVKALLDRGFDPATIEPEHFDPSLTFAIRQKSPKVFRLLLSVPGIDLNARSRNGDTALMVAAFLSDTESALALIEKGAEINRPGWTPLHYAAASGNLTILRRLLDESAFIDAESPNRNTPLMMAARGGHAAAVQLLLDDGADPTLKNDGGMSAAAFARAQGHSDLARQLDALPERRKTSTNAAD